MRYLLTTEALMSGIRAATSAGLRLDRPSMASWALEHQPAWASALDADYRVWPTRCGSPRAIRRSERQLDSAVSISSGMQNSPIWRVVISHQQRQTTACDVADEGTFSGTCVKPDN
jgi:hypothetical protein